MNSENPKLRQQQRTDQELHFAERSQHAQGREFATVEELLRFDNEQNPVPPEVAERLNATIAAEPKPTRPWYKALFG